MTCSNLGTMVAAASVLTWLTLTLALPAAAFADEQAAKPGHSVSRTSHSSAVVKRIDRGARSVMLEDADGTTRIVQVPAAVKAFDSLNVGDHVDIDYREAVVASILPPGSKPSMSEKEMAASGGPGEATAGREMSISAVIVSVDAAANKITFKGPQGQTKTVTVQDPALQSKLPSLKPGQVVQMTYREAVAASIRPSGGAK